MRTRGEQHVAAAGQLEGQLSRAHAGPPAPFSAGIGRSSAACNSASRPSGKPAVEAQLEHRLQAPSDLRPLGQARGEQIVAGDLQGDVARLLQPAVARAPRRPTRPPARRPRAARRAPRAQLARARSAAGSSSISRGTAHSRGRDAIAISRREVPAIQQRDDLRARVALRAQREGEHQRRRATRSRAGRPRGAARASPRAPARSKRSLGCSALSTPSSLNAASDATASASASASLSSAPIRAPETVSSARAAIAARPARRCVSSTSNPSRAE